MERTGGWDLIFIFLSIFLCFFFPQIFFSLRGLFCLFRFRMIGARKRGLKIFDPMCERNGCLFPDKKGQQCVLDNLFPHKHMFYYKFAYS